jgi:ketosteroid isomerase-like protein
MDLNCRMRVKLLYLILLTNALVVLGSPASDEKEILRLTDALKAARLKHDAVTVSAIFADDFRGWSLGGAMMDKARVIRAVETNEGTKTTVDDQAVRVFGNSAVYTARLTDTGKHQNGQNFSVTTCVTSVFVRRGGIWQIVAEQESIVKK